MCIYTYIAYDSGMSRGFAEPGLRVLYGAVSVMNPLISSNTTSLISMPVLSWRHFRDTLEAYKELSLVDAIDTLRALYGADRRVLVMVDEVSKARPEGADFVILTEIGELLDEYESVDVLVSSLSPQYLKILLTRSNRLINYVTMSALLNSGLGQVECTEWARNMTQDVKGQKYKEFTFNILKSVYLLASGHPRSIVCMIDSFIDKKVWNNLSNMLKSKVQGSVILGEVIRACDEIAENQYAMGTYTIQDTLEFVLKSTVPIAKQLQELSELGIVFATSADGGKCGMRLGQFLSGINLVINDPEHALISSSPSFPLLRAAATLFAQSLTLSTMDTGSGSRGMSLDVSDLWENSVALTIVSKAYARSFAFGVTSTDIPICELPLHIRLITNSSDFNITGSTVPDELAMPPR